MFMSYSPTKKGEEEIPENAVEATEGDVQGNVQIKMVVSNGKVQCNDLLINLVYFA